MRTYLGNHLGLVVDDRDPQNRGRVKIFIPHIMPSLYEGWNKENKDIEFNITGENGINGLDLETMQKLWKILPWAECAAPIIGSGPAAKFNYATGQMDAAVHNRGYGNFTDTMKERFAPAGLQHPPFDSQESQDRAAAAIATAQAEGAPFEGQRGSSTGAGLTSGSRGMCARGATNLLNLYTKGVGRSTSGANAHAMGPILQRDYGMSKVQDTGVYQNGDTRLLWNNSKTKYHQEVFLNGGWYSDFPQNNSSVNNPRYDTAELYRLPTSTLTPGAPGSAEEAFSMADKLPLPDENPSSEKSLTADINQKQPEKETGEIADGGAETQGSAVTQLATDRQRYFANELNDPNIVSRLSFLAWQEVDRSGTSSNPTGGNVNQQTAWIETVVNRAYFSGRSLSEVINQSAYGFGPGSSTINPATQEAFNRVMSGSNLTNMATDNASNAPNNPVADNRIAAGVTGAWYKNGQQVPYGTPGAEFLYRADGSGGYSTTAGLEAGKYAAANGIEGSVTAAAAQPLIRNPSSNPTVTGHNTNYMPTGMFSGARTGQLVWLFFREGDPLYPVYFAASYGASEWSNITQASSPDPIKNPFDSIQGVNSVLSLDGGGIGSKQVISGQASGFAKDETAFEIFGKSGSNLTFTFLATLLNSKYDFRQDTAGDAHYITKGNREDRTVGDHNVICEQDLVFTIGNWKQEALDAAEEIQGVIDDAMTAAKKAYEA